MKLLKYATIVVLLMTAGSALVSKVASAQAPCKERSEVLKFLANKYYEAPVAIGLANNGGVLEVLSAPSGASWTIILTMPNGTACMIAAGENWAAIEASKIPGTNMSFLPGGIHH